MTNTAILSAQNAPQAGVASALDVTARTNAALANPP